MELCAARRCRSPGRWAREGRLSRRFLGTISATREAGRSGSCHSWFLPACRMARAGRWASEGRWVRQVAVTSSLARPCSLEGWRVAMVSRLMAALSGRPWLERSRWRRSLRQRRGGGTATSPVLPSRRCRSLGQQEARQEGRVVAGPRGFPSNSRREHTASRHSQAGSSVSRFHPSRSCLGGRW